MSYPIGWLRVRWGGRNSACLGRCPCCQRCQDQYAPGNPQPLFLHASTSRRLKEAHDVSVRRFLACIHGCMMPTLSAMFRAPTAQQLDSEKHPDLSGGKCDGGGGVSHRIVILCGRCRRIPSSLDGFCRWKVHEFTVNVPTRSRPLVATSLHNPFLWANCDRRPTRAMRYAPWRLIEPRATWPSALPRARSSRYAYH